MNACGIKSFCRDKNVVIEVRIKYFQKNVFLFTIFSREGAFNILSRSMLSTYYYIQLQYNTNFVLFIKKPFSVWNLPKPSSCFVKSS